MRDCGTAIVLALGFSSSVGAACVGNWNAYTCFDYWGNTYSVQRMGNAISMQGRDSYTGSQWSQQTRIYGNVIQVQGEMNGNSWDQTIMNFGNGIQSIQGTDAQGNRFNTLCSPYGCETRVDDESR